MPYTLLHKEVGPWPMNMYVVICDETGRAAIIDPGADAEEILTMVKPEQVDKILLTHAHADHVGALEDVKSATSAPVYLHPEEAIKFGVVYDVPLADGDIVPVGNLRLRAVHTPGHTPGMITFLLDDTHAVVGDTLFVGGPGRTWSPEDFATTMETLQNVVFQWPDETEFYPGHGPSGTIGTERPDFEAFVARGWPDDLQGDVTWK